MVRLAIPAMLILLAGSRPVTPIPRPAALAADTVIVDRDKGCPGCRIDLKKVAVIDEPNSRVTVGMRRKLTCHGTRYLYTEAPKGEIVVVDSTGAYQQTIGGRGAGPGEFLSVVALANRGAETYVFDGLNARYTVYDRDLNRVRLGRAPAGMGDGATVLKDGAIVVVGLTPGRGGSELLPMAFVDAEGRRSRPFGDRTYDPADRGKYRSVSAAANGGLWAAHVTEYRIDRWSADGKLEKVILVPTKWFVSGDRSNPRQRPLPSIGRVVEDSAGLLWVNLLVADSLWSWERSVAAQKESMTKWENETWDRIIEVIDPRAGVVLASLRVDATGAMPCAGRLTSTVEDEDGLLSIEVWKATLIK